MKLRDFMCHHKLETITFGQRVNFIVGSNGSGKSATMNALTAVFGGTSRDTGKKGSASKWVRKTRNGVVAKNCSVRVTVSNNGPHPYKPDHFPDEITFERRISQSGTRYKI